MSPQRSAPPSARTAVSNGGGCLSGYVLPPLMVLVVGCLLASFALNSSASATDLEPVSTAASPLVTATGNISPVFTPEVQYWAASIEIWAAAAGLDPNLAATVMQIESCGDPLARSRAGAMGLFQVMPFHFYASDNPYDPATNAARGLDYLRRSLEAAFGDARLALAGYNGGIGVISRGEYSWAAETVRYVYWGSGIYSDAVSGAESSPRLQEWYNAAGVSLCRQAHSRLELP
jgi:soluble lytic murein transglycosylase-like protein